MKYKLTDINSKTFAGCQWGENISHTASGEGKKLCTDSLIHYYEDKYLAVFTNPIHANYSPALLWEFKPEKKIAGDALKSGCKTGMTIKQIPMPEITTEQRIIIAIRCALAVYKDKDFVKWAENWINNTDRSSAAADAAAYAANAADAAAHAAAANIDIIKIIHEVLGVD